MKRFAPIIIALFAGVALGWLGHVWFGTQTRTAEPIPQLRSELIAELEAMNNSMLERNGDSSYVLPEIGLIEFHRFFLVEGELGADGLEDFTGRIVGWSRTPAPTKGWPDRPGDEPSLSLYFEHGVLYCIDALPAHRRYLIEQGQVRQVVSLGLSLRLSRPNASVLAADPEENPVSLWRFSESGEITSYSHVDGANVTANRPAWNAEKRRYERNYRTDYFYAGGEQILHLHTGPDGRLRHLMYRHGEDRQRVLIFDPAGQVVGDYDNLVD